MRTAIQLTYHRIINSCEISEDTQILFVTQCGIIHFLQAQNDRFRVVRIEEVDYVEKNPSSGRRARSERR